MQLGHPIMGQRDKMAAFLERLEEFSAVLPTPPTTGDVANMCLAAGAVKAPG